MKTFFLTFLLLVSIDPREIAKVNAIKKEAEKAFMSGEYQTAIEKYSLLDSMDIQDPAVDLNLAHAYYHLNDTTGAQTYYQSVLNSNNGKLRSIAYQQLGVMKKDAKKYEDALKDLKSSLKSDPTNDGARYDYELVKKLLEDQQKQDQENQDQDQQNQDQQNQDQQQDKEDQQEENQKGDQEQEKKDGEEQESEKQDGEKKDGENENGEEKEADKEPTEEEMMQQKLEEMKISPEKAQMILEAMKNNEVQYLQQQKRKATKRPPSGKPDW